MASVNSSGYYATYEKLKGTSADASAKLGDRSLSVGTYLTVSVHEDERGICTAEVSTEKDGVLGTLHPQVASHLVMLAHRGWSCVGILSYIWFDADTKLYGAEVAVFSWKPELDRPIRTYITNLAGRIAKGDHPAVRLTDEQLQLVINSGGTWNEAPKVTGPKFAKDQKAVPYQTKRGMRDVLVEGAISGNLGCKVGTVLFYVALAVIVIAIVLHFVG